MKSQRGLYICVALLGLNMSFNCGLGFIIYLLFIYLTVFLENVSGFRGPKITWDREDAGEASSLDPGKKSRFKLNIEKNREKWAWQ